MKSSQLRPDTHIHPKPRELVKMADSQAPPWRDGLKNPGGAAQESAGPPGNSKVVGLRTL